MTGGKTTPSFWEDKFSGTGLCQNFMEVPHKWWVYQKVSPIAILPSIFGYTPRGLTARTWKYLKMMIWFRWLFLLPRGPYSQVPAVFIFRGCFLHSWKNSGAKWCKLAMFPHGRMPGIPAEGLASRVPKTNRHSTLQESTRAPKGSRDRIPYSNHPFSGAMLC